MSRCSGCGCPGTWHYPHCPNITQGDEVRPIGPEVFEGIAEFESLNFALPTDQQATIYMIRMGEDGPVKIGFTKNLNERLGRLQIGNPHKLTVVATISGTETLERKLHEAVSRHWIRGEWFSYSDELLSTFRAWGERG